MSNNNNINFGSYGLEYQIRLLAQILTDYKFANNILDIITPNYFEDEHLRVIASEIKDAYERDEVIPDMNSLEFRLADRINDKIVLGFLNTQLAKVKNANLNDTEKVQKIAMSFCKKQEAVKSARKVLKLAESGDLEDGGQIEAIFKAYLEMGDNKDSAIDVGHDVDSVLADDFRQPIPTGINGLDEKMDGGLSKGELAIILAPFGVGKTTMITKIANTAKNLGKNVLQIFFEDNPKVIQRKHFTCWMNGEISLNELGANKERVKEVVNKRNSEAGELKLLKMPSDSTTIPMIKQAIRKYIAKGFRPDVVLIDYIDCIRPSERVDDVNVGEGMVMRQFESMLAELDIAGWTAVQGNRGAINAETVDSTMIGGSIKKGQIGHFIVSIAKTLEQKENGTANMAILKSRFGQDGIIFENIIFNNGTIQIDISEKTNNNKTFLDTKKLEEVEKQRRDKDAIAKALAGLKGENL